MKRNYFKIYGMQQKQYQEGIYSNEYYHFQRRRMLDQKMDLTPQGTTERTN
jgi:hypothetical protein